MKNQISGVEKRYLAHSTYSLSTEVFSFGSEEIDSSIRLGCTVCGTYTVPGCTICVYISHSGIRKFAYYMNKIDIFRQNQASLGCEEALHQISCASSLDHSDIAQKS